MRKFHFTLFCFLLTFILKAQTVKEFQVNFKTASYQLSESEISKLNKVIESLPENPKMYAIEIIGHTDNVGNLDYNAVLSDNRATEIASYFKNKGFSNSKINTSGKAYSEPIDDNTTEIGKSKNRRVTVIISLDNPKVIQIGNIRLNEKTYSIDTSKEEKIAYETGTKITIPENAFVDKNGKTITGTVNINYTEYRDPIDFILGNISMNHTDNGEKVHFNSAGMYKILAFKNGEPVFINKDKSITIDFPLTENLPDLNFYQYDTKTSKWTEKSKLTTNSPGGIRRFIQFDSIRLKESYSNICSTNKCDAIITLKEMGLRLAKSKGSIYDYYNGNISDLDGTVVTKKSKSEQQIFNLNESITMYKTAINANKTKIESYETRIENAKPNYTVNKISDNSNETIFTVLFNVISNVENIDFKNTSWSFKNAENPKIGDNLYAKKWNQCSIKIEDNQTYTIVLKDSLEEITLPNLKISNPKIIDNKTSLLVNAMNNSYNIQQKRIVKLSNLKNKLIAKNDNYNTKIRNLEFQKSGTDLLIVNNYRGNLQCFWRNSKSYMTKEETELSTEEWFQYFDANKFEMQNRYTSITFDEECQKIAIERENLRKQQEEMMQKVNAVNENANTIRKTLNISELGIYNCDQISRLKEPLIVDANYKDENGTLIKPLFIYLVDSRINGILKYEGSYGYNPNHFAYSPTSSNTLLAFDIDGNSFLINSEKFKETTTKNKNSELTFVLTKIQNITTKSDLKSLF